MEAYAVIQTGGKQYRVQKGDVVNIELLPEGPGSTVTFNEVLALSDGSTLTCGAPHVEGAAVTGEVVEQFRGTKVVSFKKKRRKGYKRKMGHRQELIAVRITGW